MNSDFSQMQKRDKASEYHKKSRRERTKKIKSSYIGVGYESEKEFNFPELSKKEFIQLKIKLEKEKKLNRIKTTVVLIFLAIASFIITNHFLR